MVRGLDLFQKHFESFKGQFILIGGAASDLLHEEAGIEFRGTKDLDIVLCLEWLDVEFTRAFWAFVRDGDYQTRERSSGRPEFFRFLKPKNEKYPFMLELFSRKPDTLEVPPDQHVAPIPVGKDVSSLSAILLNDEYYNLLRGGVKEVSGIPVVRPEYLILMKAKAFLDLTTRKANGEEVDERDIKKHKNDVFRLYRLVEPDVLVLVPIAVQDDMRKFLNLMEIEDVDLKAIGVVGQEKRSILTTLMKKYGIQDEHSGLDEGNPTT